MFKKKSPDESFLNWCKKNWKDIALIGLGAFVGAQILVGLYYVVAFLFFILNAPVGAAGMVATTAHVSNMILLGVTGLIAGAVSLAASKLFQWLGKPKAAHVAQPIHGEKRPEENGDSLPVLEPTTSFLAHYFHRNPSEVKTSTSPSKRAISADEAVTAREVHQPSPPKAGFFAQTKQFFQQLSLFFKTSRHPKPSEDILYNSIELKDFTHSKR